MENKKIYNKERVLEVLKENKKGLTFAEIDNECKIGHDLYAYLSRLEDDGLVEVFRRKSTDTERKVNRFRATEKAWEEEYKEESLEILKKMIPEFIKQGVALKNTTDKQDKILGELSEKHAV